jgi:hypothetical protein
MTGTERGRFTVRPKHRALSGVFPLAVVGLIVALGATEGQGSGGERLGNPDDWITQGGFCPATRVHGARVRAGPFAGGIVRRYDVVDGRFRLHVGRYRDRVSGLTQKIPWWISRQADVGRRLRIDARRLPPQRPRRFRQVLHRTGGDERRWVFPSIIKPPAEGCWRMDFTSGGTAGSLVVLVRS